MPDDIGSAQGLVGLVSVYCNWVRWTVWSVTSISVWQHIQLSQQIGPWDSLTCCWNIKQPTNNSCLQDSQLVAENCMRAALPSFAHTCKLLQLCQSKVSQDTLFILFWKMFAPLIHSVLSCHINPLLGAAWPIVYFLQGRLGMAASFTRTYRFVCLAIVAKHLWCEQPVKEIQLTSICYVQICVYSSSYGDFLRWIDRRPAVFADSTRSDRDIFVRITIALIYSSPMNGHC